MPACGALPPVTRVMLMSTGNSRGAPLNGRPALVLKLFLELSRGKPLCSVACFHHMNSRVRLEALSGIAHPSHLTVLVASRGKTRKKARWKLHTWSKQRDCGSQH